jgi:S-adenosylhomocysteine hydrolase
MEIDKAIAALWLETHGMSIDSLSDDQKQYLESWR